MIHSIAARAKRVLPRSAFALIRSFLTALLTPIRWSYETGHYKSALKNKAVDRYGNPLPWYTYPIIDFLSAKDFSDKKVLEFGAGQSTLWWAKKARSVTAIEGDKWWYLKLTASVPSNVLLHYAGADIRETFDVIIVDGLNRLSCIRRAPALLNMNGAIIFDNSEGAWGGTEKDLYPAIDFLRSQGFSRIDFYGQCPGVILPSCTSLFFKGDCFILSGSEPPRIYPQPNSHQKMTSRHNT